MQNNTGLKHKKKQIFRKIFQGGALVALQNSNGKTKESSRDTVTTEQSIWTNVPSPFRDSIKVRQPTQDNIQYQEPEPNVVIEDQSPTPVIVMAYFRSGSSFVGDIIQAHEDVFYLFEPLRPLTNRFKISNDTSPQSISRYRNNTESILTNLSRCGLNNVPRYIFQDYQFLKISKKARLYSLCVHDDINKTYDHTRACLENLSESCVESKVMLMKVIRPSISVLFKMMETIPKLKIIYLQRDPRAMAKSHLYFGVIKKKTEIDDVTRFCYRLNEDAMVAEKIKLKYPERIMSLFYEDVAYHPVMEAQRIYKFAGLTFGRRQQDLITAMTTTATQEKECRNMCTTKISSIQAEGWRQTTSFQFVHNVDKCCKEYYQRKGYRNIPNLQLLRDLNYTLRLPDT
ncbi:carbohydrate sulfotransferase 1-like [Pecten maximus]|uniref:carbohydrate sulfotransferase 1-like n=1 Tax=Pecten maximus TaxID=6579 RepID=UPI0014589306|nr:carbohydrate sulfotransferase 1-like [Pecten maximus]